MLKRILAVVGFGCILFFAVLPARALDTQNFTIESFTADYYLTKNENKTSLLNAKEKIVALFPDYDQNHGILRAIPKSYQNHTVSLQVASVTDDNGKPYSYTTYDENDNTVLKIGDPDKYARGQTIYNITYNLRNVINFQESGDEFYWDVNGDQWAQTFGVVTARIHLTDELSANQSKQVCYTGSFGSRSQNCLISNSSAKQESLITVEANDLGSYQTLTFAVGFNKGTFILGPEIAEEKRRQALLVGAAIGTGTLPPVLTLTFMIRRWRKYGRDPRGRGVIVPEYLPPKGLNALSGGFILEETLPPKAVSAAIVELAVKHYLVISEIKKKQFIGSSTDYELQLTKDVSALSEEQNKVISALFEANLSVGSTVKLSALKNKLYSDLKEINQLLADKLSSAGYFVSNPAKTRSKYIGRGVALIIAGVALSFTGILAPLGIGLAISGAIVTIFAKAMPARTKTGVETRDYLLGLKEYINLAEKDRLKILQSPSGAEKTELDPNDQKQKIKLFENMLPYAILFGLEKDWAKEFQDIYTQPPDWYHGNWTSFNTAYLASSLSSLNGVSTAAFTAPSSSGSSGFGGGSSGGGGGGGGGGGW